VSPKFRAAIDAIAARDGGKLILSPDVLMECVDAGERMAYLDGAAWVIEQLASGRALVEILAEVRTKLDAVGAELGTREQALRASVGAPS
jgi:hypothetical protein